MAMEPPEPPTLPMQPAGFHDRSQAPAFSPPMPGYAGPGVPPGPGAPSGPGGWQPQPPYASPRPKRTGVIVMSVVAALLLSVGGVMTYLWWDTGRELTETRAELTGQVEDLTSTVSARDGEIERLTGELDSAGTELADLEQEKEGIENARKELADDLDTVAACLDLFSEFLAHIANDNLDRAQAMEEEVDRACRRADRVIARIR